MPAQADSGSPPWCGRLISDLDEADRRATALAQPLTIAQLNWKPGPGEWSVGQCLDHLCVATEVYVPPMSSALEGNRPEVAPEITPGWFGAWFIRNYIDPSTSTRKAQAPKKIAPASQVEPAVLARFLGGNQDVRALIRRAAPYHVNRVRFKNPFVPLLRFTVGTGLEVVVRHQRRHLLQAERVRQRAEFPG